MADPHIPADGLSRTALYTAWVRAAETDLFTDPLAGHLLRELGDHEGLASFVEQMRSSANGFATYHLVRTRYFDDRLGEAFAAGVRQVVTLAAGIDGRPARLPCPPGTRWFELDLPAMTEFKTALLARSGLRLSCDRAGVAADLTTDWANPLRQAGFTSSRPTAWLVEGVLMYLTPSQGDALLDAVTALSAPGSHLFLEHLQASMLGSRGSRVREGLKKQEVVFAAGRDDIADWLGAAGWRAEVHAGDDPAIGHGRSVAPVPAAWLASGRLAGGTAPGR
ncbi:SAM-dependent methyltransferase [Lentzea sp. NPDC003310]|uniref:SAM-dependent methyltransferase n=1 Tax=Lentzea sp. NPDC003310 TaxID=3154447 RepID=UPI0033A6BA6C